MAKSATSITSSAINRFYNKAIDIVFAVILLFITLTMIIGVVRLFYRVGNLMQEGGITGNYLYIFTDVLTLYILIELSRSLVEYFSSHRLRLTPIIDAGLVFVLRHIMIELFNHKLETESIYALSLLMLVLGAIRIGTSLEFRWDNRGDRHKERSAARTEPQPHPE
jgi:uncharacterized membrane protein (DUF373 family)